MKKVLRILPAIVFLIFIYSMAVLFIALPKNEYSSSEKRYLAEFPTFTAQSFFSGDFGEEFEVYLSDHTPFRNMWVGLNSYYNLCLGNPLSNGIYHCDNGYLVNDPPVTDRLDTNINVIAEFAADTAPPVTVLIAPSTGYIVGDTLPNKHIIYKDDEYFSFIKDTLKDNGVAFVDVRDEFKEAYSNGTDVYYKTDHHWSSEGAYIAYCDLAGDLNFKANEKGHYTVTSHDGFYGTTYSSSGYWLTDPDTIEIWESESIAQSDIRVIIKEGTQTSEYDSMFFSDNLLDDDKYPVFLDGNHAYTEIHNKELKQQGNRDKLLIIKDSFAHSLTPFLADHFGEIVMIDMRYYKQDVKALMEEKGFNQVLFIYSIDNLATDTDLAWLR